VHTQTPIIQTIYYTQKTNEKFSDKHSIYPSNKIKTTVSIPVRKYGGGTPHELHKPNVSPDVLMVSSTDSDEAKPTKPNWKCIPNSISINVKISYYNPQLDQGNEEDIRVTLLTFI
jgi:hypothetical protein